MARRKSLDSALTGIVESILKDTLRDQLKPLRKEVADLRTFSTLLKVRAPGDVVEVTVLRADERMVLEAVLGAR